MIFRKIDIVTYTFRVLRANFSIRNTIEENKETVYSLNNLYKFCVCCIYDLQYIFNRYDAYRKKYYMIASCYPIVGQIENVLNYLYDPEQKRIIIDNTSSSYMSYFYPTNVLGRRYLYPKDSNKPLYLNHKRQRENNPIVVIPKDISQNAGLYSELIATLNALIMYGVEYKILIR